MESLVYVRLRVVREWTIVENLNQSSVDKYLVLTNLWSQSSSFIYKAMNGKYRSVSGLIIGKQRRHLLMLSKSYGEEYFYIASHG